MAFKQIITETIAIGESQSGILLTNEGTLVGLSFTSGSISASQISFLGSTDGVAFYPLYDKSGAEVTLPVVKLRSYALSEENFSAWDYIKIREGISASPVLQATEEVSFEAISKK